MPDVSAMPSLICFKQRLKTLLFQRTLHRIVISLSKIRDHDWSYMRHVICINNQCCPMHQHLRATLHNFGAQFFSTDLGTIQYLYNVATQKMPRPY